MGKFSILFCIYLGVELLGHMLTLTLGENGEVFSKIVLLFYNPNINVSRFQSFHSLINSHFLLCCVIVVIIMNVK